MFYWCKDFKSSHQAWNYRLPRHFGIFDDFTVSTSLCDLHLIVTSWVGQSAHPPNRERPPALRLEIQIGLDFAGAGGPPAGRGGANVAMEGPTYKKWSSRIDGKANIRCKDPFGNQISIFYNVYLSVTLSHTITHQHWHVIDQKKLNFAPKLLFMYIFDKIFYKTFGNFCERCLVLILSESAVWTVQKHV